MAQEYAEGAFSQVAYDDGVWWHWRRPCAILGVWVPVAGRGDRRPWADVPRASSLPGGTR